MSVRVSAGARSHARARERASACARFRAHCARERAHTVAEVVLDLCVHRRRLVARGIAAAAARHRYRAVTALIAAAIGVSESRERIGSVCARRHGARAGPLLGPRAGQGGGWGLGAHACGGHYGAPRDGRRMYVQYASTNNREVDLGLKYGFS